MARKRVLVTPNEKASLQTNHTSISCILDQYFNFWRNLKFQKFSKNSAFFADFGDITEKVYHGELFFEKIGKFDLT